MHWWPNYYSGGSPPRRYVFSESALAGHVGLEAPRAPGHHLQPTTYPTTFIAAPPKYIILGVSCPPTHLCMWHCGQGGSWRASQLLFSFELLIVYIPKNGSWVEFGLGKLSGPDKGMGTFMSGVPKAQLWSTESLEALPMPSRLRFNRERAYTRTHKDRSQVRDGEPQALGSLHSSFPLSLPPMGPAKYSPLFSSEICITADPGDPPETQHPGFYWGLVMWEPPLCQACTKFPNSQVLHINHTIVQTVQVQGAPLWVGEMSCWPRGLTPAHCPGHLRPASCSFLYSSFVDFNRFGVPESFEYLSSTVPCIHGAWLRAPSVGRAGSNFGNLQCRMRTGQSGMIASMNQY